MARFYGLLDELDARMGGKRRLAESSARLEWPSHGVYFFFEQGEERSDSGNGSRVVRVGTHALTATSRTTLWNRLSQHRGVATTGGGNHRGSIFRLIVGEALANRDLSVGVTTWGRGQSANATTRAAELEHETRVSAYVGKMPLLWLRIGDNSETRNSRAFVERNAIALLSNYERESLDAASPAWLGRSSNRIKVSGSGLWNQNHVDEQYDPTFLVEFHRLLALAG